MESSGKGPLGRASIEAYAGIIIAIIAVVLPMTWYWKLILIIALSALIVDLACRSPLTSRLAGALKIGLSFLAIAVVWAISWNPVLEQYKLDSQANHPEPDLHPVSALISLLRGLHGPWIERTQGALATVLAIAIAWGTVAIVRILRRKKTGLAPEKGFLDHKLSAELAIVKILGPINDLSKIMQGVTASIAPRAEELKRASSTDDQLKVTYSVARSLDKFSRRMKRIGVQLGKRGTSLSEGLEGWSAWTERSGSGKQADPAFSASLAAFLGNLDKSIEMLQGYIDSTNSISGVSARLNTAVDRHVQAAQKIHQTNVRMRQAVAPSKD